MKGGDAVAFSIVGTDEREEDGIGRAADGGSIADQVAGRHKSRFVGENGAWFGVFLGRVFFHFHRDNGRSDVRFFFGFKRQGERVHRFGSGATEEGKGGDGHRHHLFAAEVASGKSGTEDRHGGTLVPV